MTDATFLRTALCLLLFGSFTAYSTDVSSKTEKLSEWGLTEIKASNVQQITLPNIPPLDTNVANVFFVVELGKRNVTLFNGDTIKPIIHFKTRFALHDSPKRSPDGRFAYFVAHNGWISKFDIYSMKIVAEVKAGIASNSLALSNDGKYVIVGNDLPHNLVIFDSMDLSPIEIIETKSKTGVSSAVSVVYNATSRYSFIIGLSDLKEIWEIPYSDKGGVDVYKGWAHDYRKDGGEGKIENWKNAEKFPIRRIKTVDFLDDLVFDPDFINFIGVARNSHNAHVINLDTKKNFTTISLASSPSLGSSLTWKFQDLEVFATPNIKAGKLTIIEMEDWQIIKEITINGSDFIMRNHTKSSYVWVKALTNSNKEKIHIIKKDTLEIVKTYTPVPNNTTAQLEFTQNGKYVLLSILSNNGAVIIYDANSLKEVKHSYLM